MDNHHTAPHLHTPHSTHLGSHPTTHHTPPTTHLHISQRQARGGDAIQHGPCPALPLEAHLGLVALPQAAQVVVCAVETHVHVVPIWGGVGGVGGVEGMEGKGGVRSDVAILV